MNLLHLFDEPSHTIQRASSVNWFGHCTVWYIPSYSLIKWWIPLQSYWICFKRPFRVYSFIQLAHIHFTHFFTLLYPSAVDISRQTQNKTKPNQTIYNSWTTAIHQNVSLLYYIQSNIVHLLEFSRSRWIWIWTNFSSRFYPVFCMRWLTITETLCGLHLKKNPSENCWFWNLICSNNNSKPHNWWHTHTVSISWRIMGEFLQINVLVFWVNTLFMTHLYITHSFSTVMAISKTFENSCHIAAYTL